jgi:hypothetical protein
MRHEHITNKLCLHKQRKRINNLLVRGVIDCKIPYALGAILDINNYNIAKRLYEVPTATAIKLPSLSKHFVRARGKAIKIRIPQHISFYVRNEQGGRTLQH